MKVPRPESAFHPLPSWREYWFPIALGAFFAILGTFPYIYGYATAPEDKAFMGFVGRGTGGLNGYFMLAKQVQEGQHFIENKSTPEPLPGNYFNLEWWIFGMFARLSGLSLMLVFHLDRIFTAFFYCLSVYYLSSRCLPTPGWRQLAVALMAFGSGLGWALLLATQVSGLELPRTFDWPALDIQGVGIFAYLVNQPHFVRAVALAALTYAFLIEGERTGQWRYFLLSGLAALLHSAVRPYHIVELHLIYAVFPAILCLRAGRFLPGRFTGYILAGLVHLPAVAFFLWLAYEDSLGMKGWIRQSRFLFSTVLWLGLPFLLVAAHVAWTGIRDLFTARPSTLLMGLWLGMAWLLVNTFPFFIAGHEAAFGAYTTAPAILACIGPLPMLLRWIQAHRPRVRQPLLAAGLVLLCMPSALYAHARVYTTLHAPVYPEHYYLDEDTLGALRWLAAHTDSGEVVLASRSTLQYVPRFSHNKTVTFHDMLTAHYYEKTAQVKQFFAQRGDDAFKQWLVREYNVRWLVFGPEERAEGVMTPEDHPWMRPVFVTEATTVYELSP